MLSEPGSQLFAEKERIQRLSRIRQFVFGSLDGLLVPLGVISGVAGGTGDSKAVIVAGLAEAFAGALSMGAGEFIAGRSEAQVHQSEVEKELQEMSRAPGFELREMALLLEHEGVAAGDAAMLAQTLSKYPRSYAKTMVEKELGIELEPQTVKTAEGLTIGISYIVGSLFPLVAYFFMPVASAFFASLALTFVALLVVGVIKGKLTSLSPVRSIGEIVLVGGLSAGGGYLLGSVVPRLIGL
jgi:vacuolar iron transporter family protein